MEFAAQGATLSLAGRQLAILEQMTSTIQRDGGRAQAKAIDALDEPAVTSYFDRVFQEAGSIDILLNVTGPQPKDYGNGTLHVFTIHSKKVAWLMGAKIFIVEVALEPWQEKEEACMSHYTDKEIEYIRTQRLGRLATLNERMEPQIAPVGFRYNAELDVIDIGGRMMHTSKKFRNVRQRSAVSLVIDDVLPPWQPRGIEIRGTGQAIDQGGKQIFGGVAGGADYWDDGFIRITPTQIISWGLDDAGYQPHNRKVQAE